jgi:hypothetical protein
MSVPQFGRIRLCLSTAVLLLAVITTAASAQNATGYFEEYCDGFGFFLAKVDGAPALGRLFLFLDADFSPIRDVPKEEWKDVLVYRTACIDDEKCKVLARGKVWLDFEATGASWYISGKYDIERNGQHLRGRFTTKRRDVKIPRVCG